MDDPDGRGGIFTSRRRDDDAFDVAGRVSANASSVSTSGQLLIVVVVVEEDYGAGMSGAAAVGEPEADDEEDEEDGKEFLRSGTDGRLAALPASWA